MSSFNAQGRGVGGRGRGPPAAAAAAGGGGRGSRGRGGPPNNGKAEKWKENNKSTYGSTGFTEAILRDFLLSLTKEKLQETSKTMEQNAQRLRGKGERDLTFKVRNDISRDLFAFHLLATMLNLGRGFSGSCDVKRQHLTMACSFREGGPLFPEISVPSFGLLISSMIVPLQALAQMPSLSLPEVFDRLGGMEDDLVFLKVSAMLTCPLKGFKTHLWASTNIPYFRDRQQQQLGGLALFEKDFDDAHISNRSARPFVLYYASLVLRCYEWFQQLRPDMLSEQQDQWVKDCEESASQPIPTTLPPPPLEAAAADGGGGGGGEDGESEEEFDSGGLEASSVEAAEAAAAEDGDEGGEN